MTFQEFLLRLAEDEGFRRDFVEDPDSVLESAGLSGPKVDALRDILRNGKLRQVRAIVEAEFEFDGEIVLISSIKEAFSHVYCPPPGED